MALSFLSTESKKISHHLYLSFLYHIKHSTTGRLSQFYLENISQVFHIFPLLYCKTSPSPHRLSSRPLQSLLTAPHVHVCFLWSILHWAARCIPQLYQLVHAMPLLKSLIILWSTESCMCLLLPSTSLPVFQPLWSSCCFINKFLYCLYVEVIHFSYIGLYKISY